MMRESKKKVLIDFVINIFASGMMTIVLQLMVYPFLGYIMSAEKYGMILTIMGIINTFIATVGNALNNVRLVRNETYTTNENGDFNILLIVGIIVAAIVAIPLLRIYIKVSWIEELLLIVALILGILRTYYSVAFRIILDFRKILFCNLFISIGYILGIGLVFAGVLWPFLFILGELFGLGYLLKNSFVVCNNCCRTNKLKETTKIYINFAFATLIANAITYLDRLLIMPILGSEKVAIYSVASVLGKSVGIIMLPIAGVLLSYFSQDKFEMNNKRYCQIIFMSLLFCAIIGLLTMVLAKPILGLLYPKIINSAGRYLIIANLSAIIAVFSNMISPIILKFGDSYWQVLINIVYGTIFCGCGYYLAKRYGLIGFCYASLAANILMTTCMLVIGWKCTNESR